jgi:ADP-ribosylglycohydrolase
MLGAIIGDIAGSIYEFDNIKTKDFELFEPHANNNPNYAMNGRDNSECFFTDDTVLTSAVANWAMGDTSDLSDILSDFTFRYSNRGYGGMYMQWANSWDRQPYNSFGNGSAMRVSSVPWLVPDYVAMLAKSKASAEVTHNHPEGIKGAQATALAIWLAREGDNVDNIRRAVSKFAEYDLTETVDEIREWYYFNETCQKTVPQAIVCALEATDFEDAIRNAISIGGDSDTVGAITGSIAEAIFGVPDEIVIKARSYLSDEINSVVDRFNERLEAKSD